jgi:nitrogen regulatory protein P-II 1
MKKVEAIIKEERLDAVKKALEEKGILGMTVYDVAGRGRQKGLTLQWRAGEYRIDLLRKIKMEIVVDDDVCDTVITTVCEAARTGSIGDGMIFVIPVEHAIRIRTGEKDDSSLFAETNGK